jgi:hypothetical protein
MRRARKWVVAVAVLAEVGCDGDAGVPPAPDGAVPVDADASDAGPDTRPAPSGGPLPVGVGPARWLFEVPAALTGEGFTGCSHQDPPSGDGHRWCAFSRPGAAGAAELWVIDVTQAARLGAPACDGSSPACLRLTTTLWTGFDFNGPIHPYAHAFSGDTLLYYADARSGSGPPSGQPYAGPVYAWRPGWAQPRRIGGDRALICWAHNPGLLAHCLEDVAGDPMRPESFELRAGAIADTDGIALASLGRLRAQGADGRPAWQAGFSPDGSLFAVSSTDAGGSGQTLRAVATSALGTAAPGVVAPDAAAWEISRDGQRVFFLREETPERRALHVADFPSGAGLVRLAGDVDEYLVLGARGRDDGVAYLTTLSLNSKAFRLLRDLRAPASAATLFTSIGVPERIRVSPDVRYTAWEDARSTVRVVRHADLGSCALNVDPRLAAHGTSFLASAGLVFWTQDAGGDRDRRDGYFADPDGCQHKQRFAQATYFIAPIGDRGIILADEVDDDTQAATLKYAVLNDARSWPAAGAVRVFEDIEGSSVVPVGRDPMFLLFRAAPGSPARQGTYVFGPLPF